MILKGKDHILNFSYICIPSSIVLKTVNYLGNFIIILRLFLILLSFNLI